MIDRAKLEELRKNLSDQVFNPDCACFPHHQLLDTIDALLTENENLNFQISILKNTLEEK